MYYQNPYHYNNYNNLYNYRYHPNHHHYTTDSTTAGAALGAVGSVYGAMSGKIALTAIGSKIAAGAGLAIASGGMLPVLGFIATLGLGILGGAAAMKATAYGTKKAVSGLKYLGDRALLSIANRQMYNQNPILSTMAKKGVETSANFVKKATSSFFKKAKEALTENMNNPEHILNNLSQNQKAENIFMQRLDVLNKSFNQNKDIRDDLKDMFQYKIPTQKALKSLQNTTAYYFIKNNAEKNNGKINLREIKKDFRNFAKEAKLSKKEAKYFESHIPKMLENLKDNLVVTKDNQFAPFEFKMHQSVQEVAKNKSEKIQKNFEKTHQKGKEQGKQEMQHQKEHENISYGR